MSVSVYGREYRPERWPYGSLRPWYMDSDEQYIESLIEDGMATARLLYMRGLYTIAEMEAHMDEAIEFPIMGSLCPHGVLPDNCSQCCGREPEWWMRPA